MSVSSTDTTFDNKEIEANKCVAPMSAIVKNRLRTVYNTNHKGAINIFADSKMHLGTEMKYNKSMKEKSHKKDKTKRYSKAIADIEFKAIVESNNKADICFKGDIIDDYQAMKEDDEEERTKEELINHGSVFNANIRKGINPYACFDIKDRVITLKDIKSYLKSNKIFLNDIKEDNIMMIMLRASDYMEHKGKNYDGMLQAIKSEMKGTEKNINIQWKYMDKRTKDLAKMTLHNTNKLREMNTVKKNVSIMTLQNYDFTKSPRWVSAADINNSIKSKIVTLNWLKKENEICDEQLKKYKEERKAANNKVANLKKLKLSRPGIKMRLDNVKTGTVNNQKIVRLTGCFKKYRVRAVDFSLSVAPLNTLKPLSHTQLNSRLNTNSKTDKRESACISPSTFITERGKHLKNKKSLA